MKKNKNSTRKNKRNVSNYIPRNPTLGKMAQKIIPTHDILYVTTTGGGLLFKSNTLSYVDIGNIISASSDYIQMANAYTLVKFHSIKITLRRLVGEIAFNAAGLNLYPVYTMYYPTLPSASGTLAVENENSLIMPGLSLNQVSRVYPNPGVTTLRAVSSTNFYINTKDWLDSGFFNSVPGIVVSGWSNIIVPTVTQDLYAIDIYACLTFASPY